MMNSLPAQRRAGAIEYLTTLGICRPGDRLVGRSLFRFSMLPMLTDRFELLAGAAAGNFGARESVVSTGECSIYKQQDENESRSSSAQDSN